MSKLGALVVGMRVVTPRGPGEVERVRTVHARAGYGKTEPLGMVMVRLDENKAMAIYRHHDLSTED